MLIYRFEIISSLDVPAFLSRFRTILCESTEKKNSFLEKSAQSSPFIGSLDGNSFQIRRDIWYRNAFLPRIKGSIAQNNVGTCMRITMHMHPFVTSFVCLWLSLVAAAIIFILADSDVNNAFALVPAVIFLFGITMVYVGFYLEAYKARRILENYLGTNFI